MNPMENEEVIQQQMAETRASLTEKLETLEQKVVGTVEEATTAVNETVGVIKESVQGTVAAVNDTVKESVDTVKDWFDVEAHVRERPWLMLGGSVAVGYCLGAMVSKSEATVPYSAPPSPSSVPSYPWMKQPDDSGSHAHNGGSREDRSGEYRSSREPETSTAQSALKTVLNTLAPEIDKLKGLALGVLIGTAREMILSSVSGHVGEQLKEVFDSVTRKAGGEPIPGSDLPHMSSDEEGREGHGQTESRRQGERSQGQAETTGRRW